MQWVNFLHIYQPASQADDILETVVNQSYRRVFRGLREIPTARVTLNISGALSELLMKKGYQDVIDDIRWLADNGKLEFTETAKHHPFLPFLPEDEIKRQIELNHKTNSAIFGVAYKPVAFFPPEMAYSERIGKIVAKMGYKIILLDEIAYSGKIEKAPHDHTCIIKNAEPLVALFRERRASNLIISAVARDPQTFFTALGKELSKHEYLFTGMDGETFGHHRPGLEEFLFSLVRSDAITQRFVSEIPAFFPPTETIVPIQSTWATSEYDIENNLQFHSWRDQENKIHQKQWELFELVLVAVYQSEKEPEYPVAREMLDCAVASDQFFWASNRPWWSIEMIEQGAWQLLITTNTLGTAHSATKARAKKLYEDVVSLGFAWQREGKIRKESHELKEATKIPFKKRTLEAGKPEVYYAFIEFMKREMKRAAEAQNYEEAILWRDAIWKLETKNDIYDAMHATDLLRHRVPLGAIEELMDQYKTKYRTLRGGQGEDRIRKSKQ